jgi:hypothetical protein
MKKTAFLVFLALIACGVLFAQTAPATTTVNGTLGLSGGRIVLKSDGTNYYVRGLERFIGFIDGLKDGAQAAIEGYVSSPSREGTAERLLFPVKLAIDGKDYEVGSANAGPWGRQHFLEPGRNNRRPDRDIRHRRGCW